MFATQTRRIAIASLCTFAFFAIGFVGQPEEKAAKPLTVGFSQIGAESAWRTANTKSIKDEAEKRKVNLKFSDAQGKQENQIRAIRTFIQQKVDIIAFAPVVETGWEPILQEAKKAGIPVILTDRLVAVSDDSLYTCFIGADFVKEGRDAAEWLVKKTDGKAMIAELQGSPGAAPAIDRKKGFEEGIAKHPGMKIIKTQSGEFNRAKGKEVFEAFLRSPEGSKITALYAHNDDMALGAIQAIEESGKKPGKDIIIVSIDGVRDAFQAILDGKLNCTVECNPLLGPQLFDTIEKIRRGEQVPKRIQTFESLFDQGNVTPEVTKKRQYERVPGAEALPSMLLEARDLVVDYPGVRALDGVDFDLAAGEVHAVLGENGAGKSTLINVLSGLVRANAGHVQLAGRELRACSPHEAEAAGISTVHQEIDLIGTMSVAENICLGRLRARRGIISWRAVRERAGTALKRLGVAIDPRRTLGACSIAEQQLVAIARALDIECRVLILDEPSSSLDAAEVRRLFDLLGRLRSQGIGIILITHFLEQAYSIADRITVLRNGGRVGTWRAAELPRTALVEAMTGRRIEVREHRRRMAAASDAPPLLEVQGLGRRRVVHPVTTHIARGETVGLAGLLGSGRTQLARLIFGADTPDSGHVSLDGERLRASIHHSIARGLAMTPEDRKSQGLFLDLSIRDNIILAMQARRGPLRPIPAREQQRLADQYISALNIKAPSADVPVRTLSGGNQQKVLLARWLAMQPRLLILDEPTRGIDVGARAEIESLITSLRDQGMSILLISAEIDEIARVCTRALIMRDRRCIGELEGDELTEAGILSRIAAPSHGEAAP